MRTIFFVCSVVTKKSINDSGFKDSDVIGRYQITFFILAAVLKRGMTMMDVSKKRTSVDALEDDFLLPTDSSDESPDETLVQVKEKAIKNEKNKRKKAKKKADQSWPFSLKGNDPQSHCSLLNLANGAPLFHGMIAIIPCLIAIFRKLVYKPGAGRLETRIFLS